TMLQNHEGISQQSTLLVHFTSFDDSSLGIFIYTFTNTANWAEYMRIQEDVNLKIMQIVEENGSGFAFPSQSVYLESMPKPTDN
ncbi:MAG TPA: mechanosensitive ion channel, partial [Campylobacterales bacterium]|nr:mechanosensitive ion channel [Campylobacterales bacterium]